MQLTILPTMDCSGRSSANAERESDLGDDLSHDGNSEDEMRDCDSVEGDHMTRTDCLNSAAATNNGGNSMSFGGGGVGSRVLGHHSPELQSDIPASHHHHHQHQFPPNHPLNALGNFMGIGGLHGLPNFQHNDVLEKLKMQVRDMKVGLMEQDYAVAHAAAFGANVLPTPMNTAFSLPTSTTMASFGHGGAPNIGVQTSNSAAANGNGGNTNTQNSTSAAATNGGAGSGGGGGSGFSFTSPTTPNTKDVNPASNSSTSSEASNSSQLNNGWSFEEQYKQVRQLYEINDDPKRKEFLDDLFSFMQKRGTPINRLPIMAKSVLDLYELYNLVIARGGLVDVINKKLWQEIIKGLHLPSSITSAAFTLRTQYMKYLYPYECEKKNLSTPQELQAAIDGNRREGRRSSYGQYEAMHNQMQMPQISRQSLPGGMQQMSPLALVTHAAAANNQQAQAAAAAAAAHHRLMAPTFGQVPNLVTHEIEQRMMEYLKLIQVKNEQNMVNAGGGGGLVTGSGGGGGGGILATSHQHQQQQHQRQCSKSPDTSARETFNALEMSRHMALWQMYQNNTSPPVSVNASPLAAVGSGGGGGGSGSGSSIEPQRSEALNLSDSPPSLTTVKREREREPSAESCERDEFHHQSKMTKRLGSGGGSILPPGFPASFYLPHGMAAAAAAANFHRIKHDSDIDNDEENEDDGEHNTTENSSHDDNDQHQLNGHHHSHSNIDSGTGGGAGGGGNSGGHHDKSDDSAIENSPSTSASAGNGHISPVSTKKLHLSKPQQQSSCNDGSGEANAPRATATVGALEALSLLSGLQFRLTRNDADINGEQLAVNLELNGIKYSGVLVANTTTGKLASISNSGGGGSKISNSDNGSSQTGSSELLDAAKLTDANEEQEELTKTLTTAEPVPKANAIAAAGLTNGPISAVLKDAVITS